MKNSVRYRNLEDTLTLLGSKFTKNTLTVDRVLKILAGKGKVFLLLVISASFLFPWKSCPVSLILGSLIFFIGVFVALGKSIWLPRGLLERRIPPTVMKRISKIGLWVINVIRQFLHPRKDQLCHATPFRIINGVLIAALGITLALSPATPYTAVLAAAALFFISLGLLEDDGVWIIVGYVGGLISLGFFVFGNLLFKTAM